MGSSAPTVPPTGKIALVFDANGCPYLMDSGGNKIVDMGFLGTTTNVSNAYTAGISLAATALTVGTLWWAKINAENSGASTLAITGVTGTPSIYANGAALVGGEMLANQYCLFEWDGTVGLYNSGFHPDRAALSPGVVLLGHLIRDAIERGKTCFDFLRGEERYKYEFEPTAADEFLIRDLRVADAEAEGPALGDWYVRTSDLRQSD